MKKEVTSQAKKLSKQYEAKNAKRAARRECQDKVIETVLGLSQRFLEKENKAKDVEDAKQSEFDECMDFLDTVFDDYRDDGIFTKSEYINVKRHLLTSTKTVTQEYKRLGRKYNDNLKIFEKLMEMVELL